MNNTYILLAILIAALCTFFLRALPFIAFNDKQIPLWLDNLGKLLPTTIMAILVVYCLKNVGDNLIVGLYKVLAVIVVVISYKWKHNTLFSIILSKDFYMLLCAFMWYYINNKESKNG